MYIHQTPPLNIIPSLNKPGPFSLIRNNLNDHSQMWDPLQPPDSCGDKILDWILDNNLHIHNNGSATRISRIISNDSTPPTSPSVGAIGQQKRPGN